MVDVCVRVGESPASLIGTRHASGAEVTVTFWAKLAGRRGLERLTPMLANYRHALGGFAVDLQAWRFSTRAKCASSLMGHDRIRNHKPTTY
jgi:hypothetical protein